MGEVIGLVAVIGTITATIIFAYLYFNSRHKVRMALIQHGKEASIFNQNSSEGSSSLKYGMLMVGIGLGIITGTILERALDTDSPVPHFSMMLILGGAGLICYYWLTKKKEDMELEV